MRKLIVPAIAIFFAISASLTAVQANSGKVGERKQNPYIAPADQMKRWLGTYETTQTDFVTIKRITISQELDGKIKLTAALVGFPKEVPIGDAIAEPFSIRTNKSSVDTIVGKFSSTEYEPLVILTANSGYQDQVQAVGFSCYMRDLDGRNVQITGALKHI